MKITALDIRQKTFEKSFRGVDKDEVQAFLLQLSQQWERMGDENRELRMKLDHATQDVQKMREVESSLYRTLKTAEDTGNSITEQAQRDAELRIREAQLKAEQLLADARQKARAVVDDAYKQAEKTIAEMQAEVSALGQEHQRLEGVLETLVRDLQHLATDALEKVEKSRNRPKSSTSAILSRAASVKVNRPDSSPESASPMFVNTSGTSSAAAVGSPAARPATVSGGSDSPTAAARPATAQPGGYNPKPGQQPDPGAPAQTPGPDIKPNPAPHENPGISDPSRIYQPEPARVPDPTGPRVEPTAPDIRPVSPDHPEITQPSPSRHSASLTEKSFFDEI